MTKEQIEQKAKNVYMRCFDDDFEYTDVLHALEIASSIMSAYSVKMESSSKPRFLILFFNSWSVMFYL